MITMYYDSSCPACTAESQFLVKACHKIQAKAVNDSLDELNQAGISQIDAMTYLCVKDDKGNIIMGIEAVRLLYQTANMPMGKILQLPIIKPLSYFCYPIFARHRYKIPQWIITWLFGKNNHGDNACDNGICQLPASQRLEKQNIEQ